MITKILYETDHGVGDTHEELLGYCLNSPKGVLKQIYLTHSICRYLDIERPIDVQDTSSGLVIVVSQPPPGCEATQGIGALDLSLGALDRSGKQRHANRSTRLNAMEHNVTCCFSDHNGHTGSRTPNYLDIIDFYSHIERRCLLSKAGIEQVREYEKLAKQLIEVGCVSLGMDPTLGALRDLWEKAKHRYDIRRDVRLPRDISRDIIRPSRVIIK